MLWYVRAKRMVERVGERMVGPSFERAFRAACPAVKDADEGVARRQLTSVIERARTAHGDLAIDDDGFASFLGASVAGEARPLDALEALRVDDLALAWACARGDAGAITRLMTDFFGPAHRAVLRILGPADGEDAMQAVREKLVVGHDGAPPRIAEYAGRGALAAWIKVVAVRVALNWSRGRVAATPLDDDAVLELEGAAELEIEHLRAHYRDAFKAAFQAALAALDARDRTLLRLQFVDDLTVDQIGALYRVHRSTAARWVAGAREALFDDTRKRLAAELHIGVSELTGIVDLVRSHVDVSLLRYLKPGAA